MDHRHSASFISTHYVNTLRKTPPLFLIMNEATFGVAYSNTDFSFFFGSAGNDKYFGPT